MSGATIEGLVGLIDGWELTAVGSGDGVTKLRLASAIPDAPEWFRANATAWVESVPSQPPDVGDTLVVSGDRIAMGEWEFPTAELTAGLVLDQAVFVVDQALEPVQRPSQAIEAVAASTRVWPPEEFVTEHFEDASVQDRLAMALQAPDFVATVEATGDDGGTISEVLSNFGAAVEVQRRIGTDGLATVSVFILADLPFRVWDRTGIGRLISLGQTRWVGQRVAIRTTFVDNQGMAVGGLEWDESADGTVTTSDGPRQPLAMASEVWAMLPGGDLEDGKQEVGTR